MPAGWHVNGRLQPSAKEGVDSSGADRRWTRRADVEVKWKLIGAYVKVLCTQSL